jgi:hypothetical protein
MILDPDTKFLKKKLLPLLNVIFNQHPVTTKKPSLKAVGSVVIGLSSQAFMDFMEEVEKSE